MHKIYVGCHAGVQTRVTLFSRLNWHSIVDIELIALYILPLF